MKDSHDLKIAASLFVLFLLSACTSALSSKSNSLRITKLDSDKIIVSLPEEHPKSFSIRNPNGSWFVLEDPDEGIHFSPEVDFNTVSELTIDTGSLKGVVWENGIRSDKKVFSVEGNYLLYFANNLETEPENTFSISIVYSYSP